ncbi:diguanylate cyclase domain-containing protein [Pandoraea communis]|uniref:GGDEF domain-containing protein n=1 Tax=Pandoraea communis TaxID=2508297 RepID=A0A5E4U7C5_9BURK|nr:diguanylate cyclase [Pandoraea communis]MDM8356315.1 diguanylate cyclase [Pandoraea communis]VVD95977.1 GGDEF domain-containing protein [Pandoraea communis]
MVKSLKGRVALATALVSMVLIVGVAVGIEFFVYGELRNSMQAQLDSQVKLVADQLDDKLRGKFLALHRMSRHIGDLHAMTPAQFDTFASMSVSMPETFNTLFVAAPDGRVLYDSTFPATPFNIADRDYFRQLLAGAPQAASSVIAGKITRSPGIVLAVPVADARGKVLAVIGGAVNLLRQNFIVDLASNAIGETGRYCLVTNENPARYVIQADVTKILTPVGPVQTLCGIRDPGQHEIVHMHPLVARATMTTTGWSVVAVVPGAEAFDPLARVRRRVIMLAIAAIGIAAFAMWWMARRMLHPLDTLRDLVQRSAGDMRAVQSLPVQRADEIGALANAFRDMMEQLGDRTEALEISREAARAHVRRMQEIADRVPYWVAFLDSEERFAFVNRACEQRLRLSRERILGATARELLGPSLYREFAPYLSRAYAGEAATFVWDFGEDAAYRCFEVSYQPEWASQNVLAGVHVFVRDITVERSNERRWRRESHTDHLTGLLNRKGFDQALANAVRRAREGAGAQALLFVDLDRFKVVNDTWGHALGDELLRRLAKRLVASVRESDAIARFGGDEFAVIMGDVQDVVDVERTAMSILDLASRPMVLSVGEVSVGACVGVAVVARGEDKTPDMLFQAADRALYNAKHGGRGRFVLGDGAPGRFA